MQWPILQPNQPNDPLPKISSQAYEMQLCLHNRKLQWLQNNVRCHYVQQRLIYEIHTIHSTPQLIEN